MEKTVPHRKALIKYLLGELSVEEQAEIAERYFEHDDWFNELLDAECELLDKYVRGALSENETQAFRRYLERLPDGQHKEVVARALTQFTDEEKVRARQFLNEYAPAPASLWQSLLKSLPKPQGMLPYLATAVLVALAISLGVLFSQTKHLRTENDQLRAQISGLEREKASLEQSAPSSPPDVGAERARQLEEQLKLEQQANEVQAQRLASLQPTTPVVASWMLTPALRSTGSPDQVRLPHSAKFVSIMMPIEGDGEPSSYRAIIQTTTGEQRPEQAGLRVNKTGKVVSLKLPASYFTETSYKITLVGKDKDGAELALDYYFTVTKQ